MENEETVVHPDGDVDQTERVAIEQDNDLSITDFLAAREKVAPDEIVKKEEGEKIGDKPLETKVIEPETSNEIVKELPAKPLSRDEVLREFGIIDPAKVALLKKMPNDSFNYMKDILAKQKSFDEEVKGYKTEIDNYKNKKPDAVHPTLYNHPQGYVLNPEYNKLTSAVNTSNLVVDHLVEQLAKIRRGEKWQSLYTGKDGIVYVDDKEQEPTTKAEVDISKELSSAQRYQNNFEQKLEALQISHSTRRKQDEEFIKEQENKFFPGYDDPKHETSQAQKKFRDMLPDTMREYVPTSIFVKTVANNAIFAQRVQTLEKELAAAKVGRVSAPPPKSKFVSSASNGNVNDNEITIEDFQRARSRI